MRAWQRTSYGFGVRINLPYAQAVDSVKAALKEQGFGVLTEIDVKRTMKEKRQIDFRPMSSWAHATRCSRNARSKPSWASGFCSPATLWCTSTTAAVSSKPWTQSPYSG